MFKNLFIFRLTEKFTLSVEELAEKLAKFRAKEPPAMISRTEGFAPVIDDELVVETNDCMTFCFQQFDKILPSSVVNDELDKRIAKIKEEQGRMVYRKEKAEIKDHIFFEFLPRAFIRQSKTFAYIDVKNDYLIVNTSSQSKAEDVLSSLRKVLEGLPALPIQTNYSLSDNMTGWVIGGSGEFFTIDDECRLFDEETKSSVISIKNIDPTSEIIAENIAESMRVSSLAVTYKDRVSFVLDSDFIIKRLKFLDLAMEERGEFEAGNEREKLLADAILMTGEIRALLGDLIKTFGGFREIN